jgi:hypothetical protein
MMAPGKNSLGNTLKEYAASSMPVLLFALFHGVTKTHGEGSKKTRQSRHLDVGKVTAIPGRVGKCRSGASTVTRFAETWGKKSLHQQGRLVFHVATQGARRMAVKNPDNAILLSPGVSFQAQCRVRMRRVVSEVIGHRTERRAEETR